MLSFNPAQNWFHDLHPELSYPQNANVCSRNTPDSIEGSRIDINPEMQFPYKVLYMRCTFFV